MFEPLPPSPPARPRRSPPRLGELPRVALGVVALVALVTALGSWNAALHPPEDPISELPPALRLDLPPVPPSDAAPSLPSGPSQAPSPPSERWARITAQDVNLRAQPALDGTVVSRSRTQERYRLTGQEDKQGGKHWRELLLPDGRKAWVSAEFVEEAPALSEQVSPSGSPVPAGSELLALNQAAGKAWVSASAEARLEVLKPMLARIFAQDPGSVTSDHVVKLDACMRASAAEADLASLKVYELGAACALALGWAQN